jgi:hypothetical protein
MAMSVTKMPAAEHCHPSYLVVQLMTNVETPMLASTPFARIHVLAESTLHAELSITSLSAHAMKDTKEILTLLV